MCRRFRKCPAEASSKAVDSPSFHSYEFDTYKKHSLTFYTILMAYADELQAVSVDEALIDATSRVQALASAPIEFNAELCEAGQVDREKDWVKVLAEKIRDDVRKATNCEGELTIPDEGMHQPTGP